MLAEKQWDYPESIELTEWLKILSKQRVQLSMNVTLAAKISMNHVFRLLCELRHTAVHRLRRTANGIEKLVENAQVFLEVLKDRPRSERVSLLRRRLRLCIEELERNKDLVEAKLLAQLKDLRNRRAELDRLEKSVIGEAFNEDKFCQEDVSAGLERTICHSELTRILSSDLMWNSRVLQSESEAEDEKGR
jgi:hypothetical protein